MKLLGERPLTSAERSRRYYLAHREERLAASAKWKREHPEHMGATRERRNAQARARWPTYREESRDKIMKTNRASRLKIRYGLSGDHYERLLAVQGGACAICRKPETRTRYGAVMPLVVDHDHETKKVRGLLCHRCNSMIGYGGDDPSVLRIGADYLEKNR